MKIDIIGIDKTAGGDGAMVYSTGYKVKTAKMYYKHPKSWNDYWSDRYGLYFIARCDGHQKRVYLCTLPQFR